MIHDFINYSSEDLKDYRCFDNIYTPNFYKEDYYIYRIYNLNREDLHIYIGLSQNPLYRISQHSSRIKSSNPYYNLPVYKWLREHNYDKIIFEIIEGPICIEKALELEVSLIKEYKEFGYIVTNDTNGGKGFAGKSPWNKGKSLSPELILKLSNSHKGKSSSFKNKNHTQETKDLIKSKMKERSSNGYISPSRKKIYLYNIKDDLINEYTHAKDVAEIFKLSTSSVGRKCLGKDKPIYKGFIFSYKFLSKENFLSLINNK